MAPKTDVIAELRSRIAELEAQADPEALHIAYLHGQEAAKERIAELEVAHAAAVLQAKQLREACSTAEKTIGIVWVSHHANRCDHALELCQKALATPISTEALDKYVAEKVKEETYELTALNDRLSTLLAETAVSLKGEEIALTRHSWLIALAKMVEITTLTRQRDLAVEAMREALECGEDGDWQSARRILTSTIKESEGES